MVPLNDTAAAADPEAERRARPVVDWLLGGERLKAASTADLLAHYAGRLVAAGLPLDRASLHIRQLHPQFAARSLVWDRASGSASELDHEHSAHNLRIYLSSPVRVMFEGGDAIRRRIERPDCPLDYPVLADLVDEGYTDYAMLPLVFSGGDQNGLSIATLRPGGFTDCDLAVLERTLPAFGAVLELQQLRRTARDLLSTYVGRNTGARIFNGTIRRGEGEVIHAVMWYCDLRGFTALSESEPLPGVIALLNDYFDCVTEPVIAHGGEILKYIGDAVLAIFPCEAQDEALCEAAGHALAAAEAAMSAVAALNETRAAAGQAPVEYGIALHIGEVMYGNIGAGDRLDFTVIGPAVNLVSRIEALCAQLSRPVVVSERFARAAVRREFRSLGRHELKGIATAQEVFAPA